MARRRSEDADGDGVLPGGRFGLDTRLLPRRTMRSPRSAPACWRAVTISVWTSLSIKISPETACEALMTVAKSRPSSDAVVAAVG